MAYVTSTEEKLLLKQLLRWKEKLRRCDDQHLEECFEDYEEILQASLFTEEDSPCRRSLFFVLEKLVLICWQECQYGRRALPAPYVHFAAQVYDILADLVPRIRFEARELWFGGVSHNSKSKENRNAVSFVAICIHLVAICAKSRAAEALSCVLAGLTRFATSRFDFVNSLIEHDERCLSTAVALLHIQHSGIVIPPQFEPRCVFFHILEEIGFDHSVVLDWLHSEAITVSFILRFMKDITANVQTFKLCALQKASESFVVSSSHCKRTFPNLSGDNVITLSICQIHGDRTNTTEFSFPKSESAHTEIPAVKRSISSYDFLSLLEFVCRLRTACQRLMRSKVAPFNLSRLIKCMEDAEETMETEIGSVSEEHADSDGSSNCSKSGDRSCPKPDNVEEIQ